MPPPTPPDTPTPATHGGARPGAGRKRGPSRRTRARWDYIRDMFAHAPDLLPTFAEYDLMLMAARRCLMTGDPVRAADFLVALRRLHARSSRVPFPLRLDSADRNSSRPAPETR